MICHAGCLNITGALNAEFVGAAPNKSKIYKQKNWQVGLDKKQDP